MGSRERASQPKLFPEDHRDCAEALVEQRRVNRTQCRLRVCKSVLSAAASAPGGDQQRKIDAIHDAVVVDVGTATCCARTPSGENDS